MQSDDFYVAGLGASAGGHQALKEFFQHLPPCSNIAFVVVTHLLREHRSVLASILSRFTNMKVHRLSGSDLIRPNEVYVLPENAKVYIKDGCLILKPREKGTHVNKIIDEFFHSLAEDKRDKAIAVIFSGMGSDGFEGVKTIHDYGGRVLVQDPDSALFKSMPETIIKEDHPHQILPPAELARKLFNITTKEKLTVDKEE